MRGETAVPPATNAHVVRSSYYFPTDRGKQVWQSHLPAPRKNLEEVLELTLRPAATGAFFHSEEAGDCRYCDFKLACTGHDVKQAAAKLENAENDLLDFRRRLKEIL